MTPEPLPLADHATVDRLGDDLTTADFRADAVLDALGPQAHAALGRGEFAAALRATTDGSPLSTLIRLFLLGAGVPTGAAAAALPLLGTARAVAGGLLERDGGDLRAALDVRPHVGLDGADLVLFADLDSDVRPGPVRPDHVLGLGSASVTLARAVIREQVGSALDLGTGCGVQALHLAAHSDRVVATDTNPRALALAAATARINGQRWDLRHGSLYEPVGKDRFDLIVSNPPFVVGAGDLRYAYRDSGVAGDALCRSLVIGARDRLRPGGTAQLLANWLVRNGADWRARVGEWVAASGCEAWVVQRDVADPARYVGLWLADAGESGKSAPGLADRWLDYFEREQVTGIGMGMIVLRRTDDADPAVTLDEIGEPAADLTGAEIAGFLSRRAVAEGTDDRALLGMPLELVDSAVLETRAVAGQNGWTTVLRLLRRPGGPGATLQLDEWSQALVAGCTGSVPLGTQIRLLADAHGIDETALTTAMVPAIRVGILRGLLIPAVTRTR